MMAAFAELERDIIHQRTMAGLAAARAHGRVGGRPRVYADKLAVATARLARGQSPTQIATALGVSRATLYRHGDFAAARDSELSNPAGGKPLTLFSHRLDLLPPWVRARDLMPGPIRVRAPRGRPES
jgi:hypothetical protein